MSSPALGVSRPPIESSAIVAMAAPMSSLVIVEAAFSTASACEASTCALWRAQADEVQTSAATSGARPRNQRDDRIEPPELDYADASVSSSRPGAIGGA